MANRHGEIDPEQLHQTGCEYGRALAKDVTYMRDDITELKEDVKELRKATKRIEEQLARREWMMTVGNGGLAAIISALVAALMTKFRG